MTEKTVTPDVKAALENVAAAAADGKLSAGAIENVRVWLTEERYLKYQAQVVEHVEAAKWSELDEAFWTVIPFGTGGRRGRMYPIGSNAINERTIGESAQGLADYVKEHLGADANLSCAIAYDTRHRSTEFARLCAEVMVAAGFTVYFLDEIRSTPELSFLVRCKGCSCGIMVTASHNPPSDNAVKAYWSTGGQILPPHDKAIIERVMNTGAIHRADFDKALSNGTIVLCKDEVDIAFIKELKRQSFAGPRDLRIIYSPLHGVGATAVLPALEAAGFKDVELFALHAEPDGDFPNVPDHVSNPENPAVFDAMIDRAKDVGADVVLATDPDCDRLGCAAPLTIDPNSEWRTFNGNQIGVLLADYVLEQRQAAGSLSPDNYLVKTLVTTEMVRRLGDSYGVKTLGNLLVGFKWIGGQMDESGPGDFVFGCEESHGYLVGEYARDKDGAVAAMLMCELAAVCKTQGKSLHERLESLYWQHGYHAERLVTQRMTGSAGMARMKALMAKFRSDPPSEIAGLKVAAVRDYGNGRLIKPDGSSTSLEGPTGDMVMIDLTDGNYVAARPSGTEPKVKFYMFTYVPAEQLASLQDAANEMNERLGAMQIDLTAFAEEV